MNIVGVRHNNYSQHRDGTRHLPIVVSVDNMENIKQHIRTLLFEQFCHHVLLRFNNALYVCEALNANTLEYSRNSVDYHPYQHHV